MSATYGKVALVKSQTALTGRQTGLCRRWSTSSASAHQRTNTVSEGAAPTVTAAVTASPAQRKVAVAPTPTQQGPTSRPSRRCRATRHLTAKACSGAGPVVQPITLINCPASISGSAGSAISAFLSASDPDSIVNKAEITSAAVPGISLSGFAAAPAAMAARPR
jgi:hypothetical protein